ncbi:MAG: DUF4198 domain-containing protein [Azospirillum sp.]|nr:DUF4198 domain-containing protein [Azospirillum sp.]
MARSAHIAVASIGVLLGSVAPAFAHFQELIPSPDLVTAATGRMVSVDAVFTHPFDQGPVMAMARPEQFGVVVGETNTTLLAGLTRFEVDGKPAWRASYQVEGPGDYIFYLAPAPYWEPAEGKYIVHYTKVVVDAFAGGEGWDALVGLPVEIKPLTRPYGLWSGNSFSGIVLENGKPAPFTEIEVEFVNGGDTVKAPADVFVTQVIKADANGSFTYTMPRAGWWGFAALRVGERPMTAPDGKDAPVEAGGLIWVKTTDMTTGRK